MEIQEHHHQKEEEEQPKEHHKHPYHHDHHYISDLSNEIQQSHDETVAFVAQSLKHDIQTIHERLDTVTKHVQDFAQDGAQERFQFDQTTTLLLREMHHQLNQARNTTEEAINNADNIIKGLDLAASSKELLKI
jgi:uncharacterized phage infection (PIP) family protein YhgE